MPRPTLANIETWVRNNLIASLVVVLISGGITGGLIATSSQYQSLSISSQNMSALVGAFVGFVGSLVVQYMTITSQKSTTKRSLRRALVGELTTMHEFYNTFKKDIDYSHPATRHLSENISTDVYQGNIQALGRLSSNETQAIVLYYSSLSNMRAVIQASSEADGFTNAEMSEDAIIRLNAVWRLVLSFLRGQIQEEHRPPKKDLVNIGEEKSLNTDHTIYNDIQEELSSNEGINGEVAEDLIERALSEGELLTEIHDQLRNAIEEEPEVRQRNVSTVTGRDQIEIRGSKTEN